MMMLSKDTYFNQGGQFPKIKSRGTMNKLKKQENFRSTGEKYPRINPLRKLSLDLVDTYTRITDVYYVKKRRLCTSESQGTSDKQYDDQYHDYIWYPNEILMDRYEIFQKIGKGSFGQVVSAIDRQHKIPVAIKIIKSQKAFMKQALMEIELLQELNKKDPRDNHFIVRLRDTFFFRGHHFLVFEYLSNNLYEILRNSQFEGISLQLLRKFTRQILKALRFLGRSDVSIIHCDLKPENILLCDPKYSHIKVIDFGSSCRTKRKMFSYIQSRFYRAPEVMLGLPYTVAIDMWSLGCILMEMHTGDPLFGGDDQEDQMRRVVQVLGMPPKWMLQRSPRQFYSVFFNETKKNNCKGNQEIEFTLKLRPGEVESDVVACKTLESIIGMNSGGPKGRRSMDEGQSQANYKCFLDLVRKMLVYDPSERITPEEALKHPFLLEENTPRGRTRSQTSIPSQGDHSFLAD